MKKMAAFGSCLDRLGIKQMTRLRGIDFSTSIGILMTTVYFFLLVNVAWFLAHELDAIQHHEWRLFFFLNPFRDVIGYRIFIALHIPLFVLIIWNIQQPVFQIIFDLYLIFHAGLHWMFRHHPKYEFHNGFSKILIFGAIPLGVFHLVLLHVGR
jgi:hypothetical protein